MILFHEVPITCINQAATEYQVPAALIMAIIQVEGGQVGLAMPNTNGSFDLGVMQINTAWAPSFEAKGYRLSDIQNNPCKNVDVGTWILSQCLNHDANNLMVAVGDYHSHTPILNQAYASKVLDDYQVIHDALDPVLTPSCKRAGQIC